MEQTQKQENGQPVEDFKVGNARAAIWLNQTKSGPWYSVTVERVYKQGDEWHTSGSFNMSDLPCLAQVASMACSWIHARRREQKRTEE